LLWWQVGCELLLPPLERLDQALRLAGEVGATVVDGTPSSYHSILNLAARLPELRSSLSGVRMWCSGGSPLSTTIAERFATECGHPVKIVPLHDDRLGSRLVFVVADAERRGTRYWRREIDRLLPPHERPNQVLVVDEFPLNRNGKPDLAALRAQAARTGQRSVRPGTPVPAARAAEAVAEAAAEATVGAD